MWQGCGYDLVRLRFRGDLARYFVGLFNSLDFTYIITKPSKTKMVMQIISKFTQKSKALSELCSKWTKDRQSFLWELFLIYFSFCLIWSLGSPVQRWSLVALVLSWSDVLCLSNLVWSWFVCPGFLHHSLGRKDVRVKGEPATCNCWVVDQINSNVKSRSWAFQKVNSTYPCPYLWIICKLAL